MVKFKVKCLFITRQHKKYKNNIQYKYMHSNIFVFEQINILIVTKYSKVVGKDPIYGISQRAAACPNGGKPREKLVIQYSLNMN